MHRLGHQQGFTFVPELPPGQQKSPGYKRAK